MQSTSLKNLHMVSVHSRETNSFDLTIEIINSIDWVILVAKWKKLIAKTVKTRERCRGYDSNQRESSTIPGIELYDIIDGNLF